MSFKPFCSTEIVFCDREELITRLLSLDRNLVLVASKAAVIRCGLELVIEKKQQDANDKNMTFVWIGSVIPNPTQDSILSAMEQIGSRPVDIVIAIGGGSSIDLAKGISSFVNTDIRNTDAVTDSIKNKGYVNNAFVDIVAVPTTSGTGSEVTQWATIWDKDKKAKYSLDAPGLQPKLAIIVPELTISVPTFMTLSTGLDAICQAIEAYWSKHTTPLVQEIAFRAVELGIGNLRKAVDNPGNLEVRENLCRASVLAGLAFAQTRTTACHSISYPLTMLHDIPHGIAASLTLDGVGKRNKGHFPNDQKIYDLFNGNGGIGSWLDKLCSGIIDMRLSTFGITSKDLPLIVQNAFTGGRMDNNPVNLTEDDVMNILVAIL